MVQIAAAVVIMIVSVDSWVHSWTDKWIRQMGGRLTEGQMDGWKDDLCIVKIILTRWVGVSQIYPTNLAYVYLLLFRTVKIDVYDWDRDGR